MLLNWSLMKRSFTLLACIFFSFCNGQQKAADMSISLDIKEGGVNKVLCMKNGNTLLFHFEHNKALVVKVFDSTRKEVASQKMIFGLLDASKLQDAIFKGLYDINNEAVLFIEQERLSKYVLIRLRFNGTDGTLVEEKIAGESVSASRRTQYYMMKNNEDDSYAIFFCTDVPQFKECKLNVTFYNNRHEVMKEVPLNLERKEYDGLYVVGAEWQPSGNCITLDLRKQLTNATSHDDNATNTGTVYGHNLFFFYIAKTDNQARLKMVDVTKDVYPYYSNFTYNPFTQSLNQLVLSYKEYYYKFGTDLQPASAKASLFFSVDEQTMAIKYKWIKNAKANSYYQEQTDSTKLFEGLPVKMFTNANGLTTAIYRSYTQYKDVESNARQNLYCSYLGNFCITQFDDEGNELWGTVLPSAQYTKSYQHFYYADDLSKRWQTQAMFGDQPEQVYNRQFLSQNIYNRNRDLYIIFNDHKGNFNNSIAKPGDTVYNFGVTNACYYKMDKTKTITKHYLMGEPATGEYKSSFIEGADFDEQRGVYATLVRYRKGNEVSLRMAWAPLD